jgi:hypothetical protein
MRPSQAYLDALEDSKAHHLRSKTFAGDLVLVHARNIKDLIDRNGCRTLLDYGCGKGKQYGEPQRKLGYKTLEEFWGVEVTKYDPAWGPFAADPVGKFDIVICTHTLGSIPQTDMGWVVDRLYGYARKALYVAEIIGPVKKRVFRRPEAMAIGWTPEQWLLALHRRHYLDAVLATRDASTEEITLQKL